MNAAKIDEKRLQMSAAPCRSHLWGAPGPVLWRHELLGDDELCEELVQRNRPPLQDATVATLVDLLAEHTAASEKVDKSRS